jgi:hypothetical protein
MNTAQKRDAIKSAYKSSKWHQKVNAMSESQIVAVYLSLQKQGKI